MTMTLSEYQEQTASTAIYPDAGTGSAQALAYVALGLAGEAGEVANKVKKILRDADGDVTTGALTALVDEAGDVLWYLTRLVTELQWDLSDVAEKNAEKLASRKVRGVLGGSGDSR